MWARPDPISPSELPALITIQFFFLAHLLPLSQYNFCIVTLSHATNLPLAIQTQGCNTIFFFTIQLGSSPNPFLLHFLSIIFFLFSFFSSKLLEIHQKKKYIYTFFFHTCYWKNTKKHKYTFFFSFLPATRRYKKYIYIHVYIYIYIYIYFLEHQINLKFYFI